MKFNCYSNMVQVTAYSASGTQYVSTGSDATSGSANMAQLPPTGETAIIWLIEGTAGAPMARSAALTFHDANGNSGGEWVVASLNMGGDNTCSASVS